MGLFDSFNPEFLTSPAGQGLLGTFEAASTPRAVGSPGPMTVGMNLYNNAKKLQQEEKLNALKEQLQKLGIDEKTIQMALTKSIQADIEKSQGTSATPTTQHPESVLAGMRPTEPGLSQSSAAAFGASPDVPQVQPTLETTPAVPAQLSTPVPQSSYRPGTWRNVDPLAAKLELVNNGGKDLARMVNDANKPNMAVHGGYAVDMNSVKPGLLPSVNVSSSGNAIGVKPGANGQPEVFAPQGSQDVMAQNELVRARMTPAEINVNGRPTKTTLDIANAITSGFAPDAETAIRANQWASANGIKAAIKVGKVSGVQPQDGTSEVGGGLRPGQSLSPTEQAAATSLVGKTGDILDASRAAAEGAVNKIRTINQINSALSNVYSGPMANQRIQLAQIGDLLGVNGATTTEKLQNTRSVINGLANMALESANKLKGQGQVSDAERALLQKASSSSIEAISVPELRILMNISQRHAATEYQNHQRLLKNAPDTTNMWMYKSQDIPPTPLPKNATAKDLVVGLPYQTAKGIGVWNGINFESAQ